MTRLAQNNIQADGIGDVFEDLDGQGRNSAVGIGTYSRVPTLSI